MHPGAKASDGELVRGRARVGEYELIFCSDGTYLLDGGAMFGVVPKALWGRRMKADEENRVLLGLNTVVVRTGNAVVVIETGVGNKQSAKMREIQANQELLLESLAEAGVDRAEVTHVINTHLHFDHCGWNTTVLADGSVVPTFPNAKYFAHAGEVAHGHLQLERDAVSYLSANYDPLVASGQMTLLTDAGIAGNPEIVPGVWVEKFAGHTANMLGVHLESGGEHACYIGDLFPTTAHLDPTWVMGFDLDPVTCIANRKGFLKRAVAGDWMVIFTHDHHVPAARIRMNEKGKPVAVTVELGL